MWFLYRVTGEEQFWTYTITGHPKAVKSAPRCSPAAVSATGRLPEVFDRAAEGDQGSAAERERAGKLLAGPWL